MSGRSAISDGERVSATSTRRGVSRSTTRRGASQSTTRQRNRTDSSSSKRQLSEKGKEIKQKIKRIYRESEIDKPPNSTLVGKKDVINETLENIENNNIGIDVPNDILNGSLEDIKKFLSYSFSDVINILQTILGVEDDISQIINYLTLFNKNDDFLKKFKETENILKEFRIKFKEIKEKITSNIRKIDPKLQDLSEVIFNMSNLNAKHNKIKRFNKFIFKFYWKPMEVWLRQIIKILEPITKMDFEATFLFAIKQYGGTHKNKKIMKKTSTMKRKMKKKRTMKRKGKKSTKSKKK